MVKRQRGKPLELSRQMISDIAEHIGLGGSLAGAAKQVGKNERTLRRWNQKGREGVGGIYAELWEAVLAAEEHRDRPKTPRPQVTKEIIEATILECKDEKWGRTEIKLTSDDYEPSAECAQTLDGLTA